MPGTAAYDTWPPPGEFAGVGLFTIVLIGGLAAAIVIGWRRTVLIAIGLPILSAWLMRHLFASWMYETGYVRLYPRTSILILFGSADPRRLRRILAGATEYELRPRQSS